MTVIVGFVPNPSGEAALEAAIQQAQFRQVPLIVLNSSRAEAYADNHLASEEQIQAVKDRLADLGVEHEFVQQARGHDAADEVLEVAEARGADLIVIGIRRRTPVGKLLMGSTAQRVLLAAACPVLAVKA